MTTEDVILDLESDLLRAFPTMRHLLKRRKTPPSTVKVQDAIWRYHKRRVGLPFDEFFFYLSVRLRSPSKQVDDSLYLKFHDNVVNWIGEKMKL